MAPGPRMATAGTDPGQAWGPLALEMEPQQTAARDRQHCRAVPPLPAWGHAWSSDQPVRAAQLRPHSQTRRSLHCEWLAGSHCPGALERVLESRFPDFSLAVVPVPCFLVVICFRVSFRHRRGQAVAAWRRPQARLLVSPVVTLQSCRPRAACFPFLLKLLKSGFLYQMPSFSDVTSI